MTNDTPRDYAVRPIEEQDFEMVVRWLRAPMVSNWWPDSVRSAESIRKYLFDDASIQSFIGSIGSVDAAYLQTFDPHAPFGDNADPEHDRPFRDQPAGSLGMEMFIGRPELAGGGHGARLLNALAESRWVRDATTLILAPDVRNGRAIRAYEKAGFDSVRNQELGHCTVRLMRRTRPAIPANGQ